MAVAFKYPHIEKLEGEPARLERMPGIRVAQIAMDYLGVPLYLDWQRQGRSFAGLLFGHQRGATLGKYITDLEIAAKATEPADWLDVVEHQPL